MLMKDKLIVTAKAQVDFLPTSSFCCTYQPPAKRKNNTMHNSNIQPIHNLYDPEHPQWYIYDPEPLNAWYWEQFTKEIQEEQ
jgi:hypothetical protein